MNPKMRKKARRFAVQAIYQWQLSANPPRDIEQQFLEDNNMNKVDVDYFNALLFGVVKHQAELDGLIVPHLNRKLEELDPVELAVMRMATYELKHRVDVPYKVVINEALEQNKVFGSVDGHKYVNGVLDKVAHETRAHEIKRPNKGNDERT